MEKYLIEATRTIDYRENVKASNMQDAIDAFRNKHPKARIDSVNDMHVLATCEFCATPIFKEENLMGDGEIEWCKQCEDAFREDEKALPKG